ncbi:MAG: helix-turn-helix domain-containing protein [bacterium]|nr:helix-turn-helix domain-containing protein [bacterium]
MKEEDILIKFGHNLCAERNRAGLSQEGLGEKINLSSNQLGKIERGVANPKLTTIIAILKALNIDFNDLYK